MKLLARPQKTGLDYFPFDVKLDDKFELIEAEFGLIGFAVLIKLMQKIYSNGYYCKWSREVELLFAKKNCTSLEVKTISSIIKAALSRDIFDLELFEMYSILTSKEIQERYFEAVKRRKQVEIIEDYLLINTEFTSSNEYINSQSKVNETKLNENKQNKINFCENLELNEALNGFVEFRKNIKNPMTDRAVELLIKKLEKFEPNNIKNQIAILEQSIVNGWKGVYELKKETNSSEKNVFFDIARQEGTTLL